MIMVKSISYDRVCKTPYGWLWFLSSMATEILNENNHYSKNNKNPNRVVLL